MTDETPTAVDILLVQDDPVDAVYTREVLEAHGLRNRLAAVADGQEAADFLRGAGRHAGAFRPGLVLLDPNLPRLDGRQVLRLLRADPATADVPVILLADSPAAEQILRREELPVQGYAVKPVDFACLVRIVVSLRHFGFAVMRP